MRRTGIVFLTTLTLSMAACKPAPMSEAQTTALADTIRQRATAFLRSLQDANADSVIARYDPGMVFGRAGTLVPYDSLVAGMRRNWTPGLSLVVGASNVHVVVLGPDAAVYSALLSGVVRDTTQRMERPVRGAITLVMQRAGARWKIVAAHESSPIIDVPHESDERR